LSFAPAVVVATTSERDGLMNTLYLVVVTRQKFVVNRHKVVGEQ
jgi:hypothetical protein